MKNKNIAHPALRLLAYLVDFALLVTAPVVVLELVSQSAGLNPLLNSLLSLLIFMIAWTPLVYPLLQILLVNKLGGTVGKLLCGLEIVDKDNKFLSFKYAFLRNYVGRIVSGSLFYLGFIWILVDKERRGWHDLIAGSWVTVKRKLFALIGFSSLVFLIALNSYLGSSIYKNVVTNLDIYQNIYSDAQTEIEGLIKEAETETSEEVGLEEFNFEDLNLEDLENVENLEELELKMRELENQLEQIEDGSLKDVDYEASPQTEIS